LRTNAAAPVIESRVHCTPGRTCCFGRRCLGVVRFHDTGTKHFHHPVVGDLSLHFERLELSADFGLTIVVYAAEPGSQSEEALNLLGSWAATVEHEQTTHATDQA
jgi:MmyB-like transcription regulator ligand binding domain